jgi:uncharacterized membrane protein YfhO
MANKGATGNTQTLKPRDTKRREYIILAAALLLAALVVYHPFVSREFLYLYYGLNDDTYQSYLPAYQLAVNMIEQGNFSFYSFAQGQGANILAYQGIVFDPFAIPVYIVGLLFGVSKMAYRLIVAQILRVIAAGLACRFFLGCFKFSPVARCVASFAFAFSSSMVGVMAQHYQFATAPVLLALILGCVERSFRNRRYLIAVAVIAAVLGIWSVYFSYMILLAVGIFIIFRFLQGEYPTVCEGIRMYLSAIPAILCGLLMAGVILLPAAALMLTSNDLVGSQTSAYWPGLGPIGTDDIRAFVAQLFSGQLNGGADGTWYAPRTAFWNPQLAFSVFIPLAFCLYIVNLIRKPLKRKQLVSLVFAILIVVSSFIKLTGFVFNAFSGYEPRYMLVLHPAFAFVFAWFLTQLFNTGDTKIAIRRIAGVVSLCSVVFIALTIYRDSPVSVIVGVVTIATLIIGTLLVFALRRKGISGTARRGIIVCFCALSVAGVCAEAYGVTFFHRSVFSSYGYDYRDDGAYEAIKETDASGSGFWRFDRAFTGLGVQPYSNYAETEYYRGIGFYNSLAGAGQSKYMRSMLGTEATEPERLFKVSYYSCGTYSVPFDDVTADITGLKYVSSAYPTDNPAWEKIGDDGGGSYLYRNRSLDSAGLIFTTWCSESDFENLDRSQKMATPAHTLVLNTKPTIDLRRDANIPVSATDALQTEAHEFTEESSVEGVEVPIDSEQICKLDRQAFITFDAVSDRDCALTVFQDTGYDSLDDNTGKQQLIRLFTGQVASVSVKLAADAKRLRFFTDIPAHVSISNEAIVVSDGKAYGDDNISFRNERLGNSVQGSVIVREGSMLLLPILYERGWTAEVDGKPSNIYRADFAYSAVEIPEGEHEVTFTYETPYLKEGGVASAAGIAIFVLLIARKRRVPDRAAGVA